MVWVSPDPPGKNTHALWGGGHAPHSLSSKRSSTGSTHTHTRSLQAPPAGGAAAGPPSPPPLIRATCPTSALKEAGSWEARAARTFRFRVTPWAFSPEMKVE